MRVGWHRVSKRNLDWVIDFYRQMAGTAKGRQSRDEKRRNQRQEHDSQPFDAGRDPVSAGSSLDQLFTEFRWTNQISKASLFTEWPELVGRETAAATTPEEIQNGTLIVRCSSTAWATQLNLISHRYLETITQRYPDLGVRELRFQGPAAPSWKKGPKSVSGRGPRDTYG